MDKILLNLEKILEQRKTASSDKSYVASLYNEGTNKILEKISEESEEVIMAAKNEGNAEIIHEIADLWFHTLVLLRHKNISVEEIESELARRFGYQGMKKKLLEINRLHKYYIYSNNSIALIIPSATSVILLFLSIAVLRSIW